MSLSAEAKKNALLEYFDECRELLERLLKNLSLIEKKAGDKQTLAAIYRDIHTIKGSSQLFGFKKISLLSHMMETCLDPVRKGKIELNFDLIDNLYLGLDYITILLKEIAEKNQESNTNIPLEKIISKFISIIENALTNSSPLMKEKSIPLEKISLNNLTFHKEGKKTVSNDNNKPIENPGFGFFDDEPSISNTPVISAVLPSQESQKQVPMEQAKIIVTPQEERKELESETIRVQVSILDSLMNLIGELVLIRNQLLQHTKSKEEDVDFLKLSQRLNILTAELQNEVMKTRMQPIGNVFQIFTRVVRDLSKELGKKINLDLNGIETELDKTILESVKDPLMHVVRNAIDHGIESQEERKKFGKKETATIQLKAFHESGQVNIEVFDDGRGLDKEKIGPKAVEKGLISQEILTKMTEKEVQLLIFSPGFSTASSVSNISGRGVGMDVVKTNLEKIGGIVDIFSKVGCGTTIKMKIPLSLAIVPALIVRAQGQRFAIPQSKLIELLRIEDSNQSAEKIEMLQGKPVLRLRGKLLPIVSLSEILDVEKCNSVNNLNTEKQQVQLNEEKVFNIVVLNADGQLFGLIVDEIDDSVDIVVKSLSHFLKEIRVFSGATIMGDGTVALTIDVMGISETAGFFLNSSDVNSNAKESVLKSNASYRSENCEILLIDVGAPENYAIPLAIVSRIEEFDKSLFEHSGEQRVVRYRDYLLPIFSLPEFLQLPFEVKNTQNREKSAVVVIKRGDDLFGIEVFEIKDIIEISSNINQSIRDRAGILGTVVVKGHVIVFVDILGMIDILKNKLDVSNYETQNTNLNYKLIQNSENKRKHKILVVEDSAFFRNYIRQILQEDGYCVEVACDGQEGYNLIENNSSKYYSLIISDIEMPVMDGYTFVRKIRETDNYKSLPMVAITTKFSASDIEQGKTAGFNQYLEKLNAEKLLFEVESIVFKNNGEGRIHA